jgi:xylulokinase
MYLLGFDVGSSSVKASLVDGASGEVRASACSPDTEMEIIARKPGWGEQHPLVWWENVKAASALVMARSGVDPADVRAIGIAYQMHGLVTVGRNREVLMPAIIWCDSRAVEIGERAFHEIGEEWCLNHLLNSPGNFTASKLRWVRENEPEIYRAVRKAMLPGEYIAMKMTGEVVTTPSGLSEWMLWDYLEQDVAKTVLAYYDISPDLLPGIRPAFSAQGELTREAAAELGLRVGTPVTYRGGDQPNNALSLRVLNPGEIAATAGTSGVIYGVSAHASHDSKSRVNTFLHGNSTPARPRYGVLVCINGTGSLNRWLRANVAGGSDGGSYGRMNDLAARVSPGAEGLYVLPYGNGAERTLENRDIGCSIHGLDFNVHTSAHLYRAAQEGIVFGLEYGLEIARAMGVEVTRIRAGAANMFLSGLFGEVFAAVTGTTVELFDTDGAQGAARAAGIGAGVYATPEEAFEGSKIVRVIEPDQALAERYRDVYGRWRAALRHMTEANESRECER